MNSLLKRGKIFLNANAKSFFSPYFFLYLDLYPRNPSLSKNCLHVHWQSLKSLHRESLDFNLAWPQVMC